MSEQLVNYIISEIKNGHKTDSVESFLKTHGYDHTDVEKSIKTAIDLTAKSYIPYLETQVKAGYELSVLRTSLISQGYDQRIIDHAINHYFNNFFKTIEHIFEPKPKTAEQEQKKKQNEEIDEIIKTNLTKGFTLENIRSTLLEQGYEQTQVNTEINKYYHSHFHISKQTAFAGVAIILAIVLVGGFGFLLFGDSNSIGDDSSFSPIKSEERLLDVNVENAFPKQSLIAGDNLNFNVDIDNMGTQREYDLYFTYAIEELSGKKIRTKKVTKSTISSMNDYIQIPRNMEPGKYILSVTIDYQGEIPALAEMEFEIVSEDEDEGISKIDDIDKQEETDEISNDNKETTQNRNPSRPTTDREVIARTPLEPGTYIARSYLTHDEKEQLDMYMETEDFEYALFKCRQITVPALKNECKYYVISNSNNVENCEKLDEGAKQDKCYLDFAKESSDLSICSEITERTIISACKMHILNNKNKALQNTEDEADFYKTFQEVYGNTQSNNESEYEETNQ